MSGFIDTLNSEQKQNLDIIIQELDSYFTNPITKAGILSIVAKESAFKTKPELSYRTTSNDRIRKIFGSRVKALTDTALTALKSSDVAFFDHVYGKGSGQPLGNTLGGDGYKYRGRGFNGLTGRANYKFYGEKIGEPLEQNPDLLNDPKVAAKALVMFFRMQAASKANKISQYNAASVEDFKTVADSTGAFYHANAGWGKPKEALLKDQTGGRAKAISVAPEFLEYLGGEKKNPLKKILMIILILMFLFFLFRFFRL